MKSVKFKKGKTWSYPGNLTRDEAKNILGFDPGPPSKKKGLLGTITKVDREKGIITVSTGLRTSEGRMKIYFEADEWYPVYSIARRQEDLPFNEVCVDLSESEIEDFKATFKRFQEWQDRIREVYQDESD